MKLGQAEKVPIGKDGLTLIGTIARQNILTGPSSRQVPRQGSHAQVERLGLPGENERVEFARLVAEYGACDIPELADRIRAWRRLADRLGELALSLSLDRRDLAASGVEGRVVAMATAVILSPRAGDLAILDDAAERAEYNFTRYRIVLALPPALTIDHDAEATRLALSVLARAQAHPNTDADLRGVIQATRQVIQPQ